MAKILIVEDDPIMLKAIGNILTKSGFTVTQAKNGKEAIECIDKDVYDLVITDLMLPYNSGIEIISRIKDSKEKLNTGIIVVSSVGSEEIISEVFRLGADDFLKKPIMIGELTVRIKKLLNKKEPPKLSL